MMSAGDSDVQDQLARERDQLVREKKQLVEERDQLVRERDQVVREKKQLVEERDQLVQEKKQLVEERDQLVREKDQLVREKKQLVEERDQLRQVKDKLTKENEKLQADNSLLTVERELLNEKVTELQKKIEDRVRERNTPRCPRGWRTYMSTCYQHSSVRNTWEYANQNCASQGSHLVIFNDEAEERTVRSFGQAAKVWMGLSGYKDPCTNSWTWTWVDGGALSFVNWNYQNIDWRCQARACAYVDQGSRRLRTWFRGICQEQHYWVCEKKLHT
ncbi:regenerating islet-derived protein 3-gamma-like [Epinephelus lanceolatus]